MSATRTRTSGDAGYRQVYDEEHLSEISFPLGGIGTGCIGLGGRGDLRDWEIFNRPAKGQILPYSFFALWCQTEGQEPVTRVLERRYLPPYRSNGFGLPTATLAGMPRFSRATFRGEYPFAWLDLTDARVPLQVQLEAFNPLIPLNSDDSGLPVAIFRWTLRNPSPRPVAASVCGSLLNAVGWEPGLLRYNSRLLNGPGYGGNLNEPVHDGTSYALRMTSDRYQPDELQFGSLALMTQGEDVSLWAHWPREGWWHPARLFWDAFSATGRLDEGPPASPSPEGRTDVGSIAVTVSLAPDAEVTIPFVITWYFPNRDNYFDQRFFANDGSFTPQLLRNYYATRFADAYDVARYTLRNLDRLRSESLAYHQALYTSSLPPEVIEAVGSTVSILKSPTVLRLDDGTLHGFEGCHDDAGCCPLDCTHVWNYEQTMAHLFPDLERSMRRTELGHNTRPSGEMAFRTRLPLTLPLWDFKPAADGQLGTILKLYREWLLSGDRAFLEALWPAARRALAWTWEGGRWDVDADGVIEGEQHNTLDIEFHGPNPMIGLYYLAALRAGEKLAREVGDERFAERCRELERRGRERLDAELWNGEYYVQKYDATAIREHQVGEGCLTDQLVGQWWAHLLGLGHLLREERIRQAAQSIFRYNFRTDLSEHDCHERTFALNEEAGLVICSWPKGKRPRVPVPYAYECMSGFEYAAAALLMMEGFVDEGLQIIRAIRDRYDGRKRNPWNEEECGHNYARPLASYSALLALSGFRCEAARGILRLAPIWRPHDFRCFWAMGTAWGQFAQRLDGQQLEVTLSVIGGSLRYRELRLRWPGESSPSAVAVHSASGATDAAVTREDGEIRVTWPSVRRLEQGMTDRVILIARG